SLPSCNTTHLHPLSSLSFSFHDPPPTDIYTSFPTRRSSDLIVQFGRSFPYNTHRAARALGCMFTLARQNSRIKRLYIYQFNGARSEEHTSELQSRGHLVCRLLLEKKKKPHTEACSKC